MKRVLMVAYDFPPQPNAAAVRLGALARLLPRCGWETTVVTRPAAGEPPFPCTRYLTAAHGSVDAPRPFAPPSRRAPFVPQALREIVRGVRRLRDFPDPSRHWVSGAVRAADEALRDAPHHALITSHGPSAEHLAGAEIVRRHRLPWVADYRDLWTGQPWTHREPLLASIERRMEQRALRGASAVTTVAPALRAALAGLLHRDDIEVLTNVVDDDVWSGVPDAEPSSFALLYAGRLHYGRRDPRMLFEAIATLKREGHPAGERATFIYYGREGESLTPAAVAAGLDPAQVSIRGIADRAEILRAEREAAVLVVLMNMEDRSELAEGVPSKAFEYAGAGRPILALGPPGSEMEAFLGRSGLGVYVTEAQACAKALEDLWNRFSHGVFRPEPLPSWRPFRAGDLAAAVANILDRISAGRLK